ncbi:hypothetical protein RvY_10403 [Ramazzottius varieornatus]|uniref:CSN8/PSMD8/EIF3K domain-containing protein n=1 Tax=Ramazzottius varieornatus TaxID=947166 RepID=A0A1D1VLN2_RAMVA|nr:hypothetical protein RvY_10403 [Ramazzottius varieornatus]
MEAPGNSLPDHLERAERSQNIKLSADDYAQLMLTSIVERRPIEVAYIQMRLPDEYKGNALLLGIAKTAEFLHEKSFSKVHSAWKAIVWPESLVPYTVPLNKRMKLLAVEHIRQVYDIITLQRFADLTGHSNDQPAAASCARENDFIVDAKTNLLKVPPLMPGESIDGDDWGADLENLTPIGDTVSFLSRTPYQIVVENAKKNDY